MEQGRTRQRPRSQPLSHEYYRSPFLFGVRGRYVSPGACVGCCLGEDAKLAVAPLTQSLFSRPRGRRPPRGRRRHAMAVGALVPPDAARIATVYTNAPERRRGAIFADLCTLLCPHVCPQRRNSVHKRSKTAPRGHSCRSVYTPDCLHVRSRDRTASRVPRRRQPHGPTPPGWLGSEVHAARAVTHPPTRLTKPQIYHLNLARSSSRVRLNQTGRDRHFAQ